MEDMSKVASNAYRQYLIDDSNFLRYFNTVTPKKVLEQLFIGSRPARRKKSQDIKNLACNSVGICLDANSFLFYQLG